MDKEDIELQVTRFPRVAERIAMSLLDDIGQLILAVSFLLQRSTPVIQVCQEGLL